MLIEGLPRGIDISQAVPPGTPLLTIACPTYNRARYLDRFFEHHLTQFEALGIEFEVLVCDNASTDRTPEIIAAWAAKNPRIRSVRHSENIGAYGNFLYAYRQARGQFSVWVGDDDLLIADAVLANISKMLARPTLHMVQAPWILMDETHDNAAMGTFYDVGEADRIFERGQHQECLDFMLQAHVFPEWFILRNAACKYIVEPGNPHVYHYFGHLARALQIGDVAFAKEPFARVTAVSLGDNRHTGNSEAMTAWDSYRGGIEFFASFVRDGEAQDPVELEAQVTRFTLARMRVAVRLNVQARNWLTAYQINRRLQCYGASPLEAPYPEIIAGLAALETVVNEASAQARRWVVLDDAIKDETLDELNPPIRDRLIRRRDPRAASIAPKAFALLQPPPASIVGPDDILVDLAAAFRRLPS